MSSEEIVVEEPVAPPAPPSITDTSAFPSLGESAPAPTLSWGPNMSTSRPQAATQTRAGAQQASRIQDSLTLDLSSHIEMSKPEFAKILVAIRQENSVSVESTVSSVSRTYLISGAPAKVSQAKRQLVKRLSKPIVYKFLVPSKTKAAVIGAGGDKIKRVQAETGVRVSVAKTNGEYDEEYDDEMVDVTLEGDVASVPVAEQMIMEIVKRETQNMTATVEAGSLAPFVELPKSQLNVNVHGTAIVISGARDEVKALRDEINTQLAVLGAQIKTETVAVPAKFQPLIDVAEIKKQWNVLVEADGSEKVAFTGKADKIKQAIAFARASSSKYVVETLEISKAHSGNVEHAQNLVRYFLSTNAQLSTETVKVTLPSAEASPVVVQLSTLKETAEDLKAVRKQVIDRVNEFSPEQVYVVEGIDSLLQRSLVSHAEQAVKKHPELNVEVVTGDSTFFIANLANDEFRPSANEIKQRLETVAEELAPVRSMQEQLTSVVVPLESSKQAVVEGPQGTTLKSLLASVEHPYVEILLHTPSDDELLVRGIAADVAQLVKQIKSLDATEVEHVIHVPQVTVSRLVGSKGANLQALRNEFGVKIEVAQGETEKVAVTLSGFQFNVSQAAKRIAHDTKKWADEITVKIPVPAKYHRRLIGSQGVYVNRLQDKYNVAIKFLQKEELVTVKGPTRGVHKAEEEIKELLNFEIDNDHKQSMEIPQEAVARVIGRSGEMINDIEAAYGVSLKLNGNVADIVGSRAGIKEAAAKIKELIEEQQNFISTSLEVDSKYHRDIVGPRGSKLREIITQAGGDESERRLIQVPSDGGKITLQGNKAVVNKIIALVEALIESKKQEVSVEIEVPSDKLGALVGPGGMTRRELEAEFDVVVRVPNKNESGNVVVTGQPEACEKCKAKILDLTKDKFDVEIMVPLKYHEFVSERGALIAQLRRRGVTVKHGSEANKCAKINKKSLAVPSDLQETRIELCTVVDVEGEAPWQLTFDDKSLIESVTKEIEQRLETAAHVDSVAYIVCDPKKMNKVVGPGGATIANIRDTCHVLVNVPKKTDAVNNVIYVKGTNEGVTKAHTMIKALIA